MHSHNITKFLFQLIANENINYSVLRNYESLPESCGGSDLDIFVAIQDLEIFYSLLSKAAMQTESKLVSYTADSLCPKVCYLNEKDGIQIDVFKGSISCKGYIMVPESEIVNNTIEINSIKVLNPCFGDLIAFLKEVLNNGSCDEKYINPIKNNKEVYTKEYLTSHLSIFSHKFCDVLAECIESDSYTHYFTSIVKLGLSSLGTSPKLGRNKFVKLDRLFHQPGYTIAVLGTDGSGKSFIINSITPILNTAFHKGVRYEHMRPNLLPSLAVLSGKKKAGETEVCSNPHAERPSGFIGSVFRLSYYWIDYTLGFLKKIFLDKALKTHLWIFDRYYYDYYIDQRRAKLHLPNWIIRLYGIFVPKPDLILCLGGDPEKIYARKPETSLEEVMRQTMILKEICQSQKRCVWIDTTSSPQESINQAMTAIVSALSTRFSNIKLK